MVLAKIAANRSNAESGESLGQARALSSRRAGLLAFRLLLAIASIVTGFAVSGCSRRAEEYIPEPQVAESAVRRALSAWQAGQPAGEIPDTKPTIFVTDANRKPKQRLKSFEILGETPGRSGRTYVVQLALDAPAEQVKAEYIVVGIDPLWVFRREDYELLMHWDHYMPESTSEAQTTTEVTQDAAGNEDTTGKK